MGEEAESVPFDKYVKFQAIDTHSHTHTRAVAISIHCMVNHDLSVQHHLGFSSHSGLK